MSGIDLDYPVRGRLAVASADELREFFSAHDDGAVRIVGTCTKQHRLPAPPRPVTLVSTAAMTRITRLEPDDLTCSVEPGVTRHQLDDALAETGAWLPCAGTGTMAGIFAADLDGPLAPGALSPRALLLGLSGVLAEGLPFKSGARVVKSVAGFDLQKLFVGSRGRLFAATELHLKLRPRPQRRQQFARAGLDLETALAAFHGLRTASPPPIEVWLERMDRRWRVHGELAGHGAHIDDVMREHRLEAIATPGVRQLDGEVLIGAVRPSQLAAVIGHLPDGPFMVNGVGRFQSQCPATAATAVMPLLERRGVSASHRGVHTALDRGVARLQAEVTRVLDPRGVLA